MLGDDVTLYRALMLDSTDEYERLIETLSTRPDDAVAIANRALAYAEIGEIDDALEDFAAAVELLDAAGRRVDAGIPLMNRGDLYRALGRLDNALADYGAAIERDPTNVSFRRARAGLLHDGARFAEAIADYDLAIEAEPDFVPTREARERARAGKPAVR